MMIFQYSTVVWTPCYNRLRQNYKGGGGGLSSPLSSKNVYFLLRLLGATCKSQEAYLFQAC